jgi:hypothetical protein
MLDRRWLRQFGERSANQRDIAQAALTAKINATQKKIRMALGPVVLIIATDAFSNHTFDIGVVSRWPDAKSSERTHAVKVL